MKKPKKKESKKTSRARPKKTSPSPKPSAKRASHLPESLFPKDWLEFLALLTKEQVKFLLIGAHALAAHGMVRATRDLDVFIDKKDANLKKLARAMEAFGFSGYAQEAVQFKKPNQMMMIGVIPFRIDILNSISGVEFEEAWASRLEIQIGSMPIQVLGRSSYIKNKLASGRDKDFMDVILLEGALPKGYERVERSVVGVEEPGADKRVWGWRQANGDPI